MNMWKTLMATIGIIFFAMGGIALIQKPKSIYGDRPEERNPYEGKKVRFVPDENESVNADGHRGHLEVDRESVPVYSGKRTIYESLLKRCLDLLLSFLGLLILFPILLVLSVAIYVDDPGPVLFTQKRLGKNKRYFEFHKFRSMKMATPHDVPTHMLENPQSYITRIGKLLRRMSLDELPQLWDVFIGNMSLVGPRPGLWNQDILTAERDKYHANDVRPGLTGWAQVNGRDELMLDEKARLDGEYCSHVSFKMDLVCILMTVVNVLKQSGIIEGGTGALKGYIEERHKEIEGKK